MAESGLQAARDIKFESHARHVLRCDGLASVWSCETGNRSPASPANLVTLAADACQKLAARRADAPRTSAPADSDYLLSSQGAFLCAEADLCHDGPPVLVFAVSESVISYQDYAVKLPVTEQLTDQTVQHYHPAVQQAAASKLPLQQLAWMLCDQPCRLLVCGKGTAGAVAQQAAIQIQQMLSVPLPDEESCYHPKRVLCITFGAPPTHMSAWQRPQLVMPDLDYPSLFWNFLLADAQADCADSPDIILNDVLPALFSSVPISAKTKQRWIEAAGDVLEDLAGDASNLQESMGRLARAGHMQKPAYLGHTWFLLPEGCAIASAKALQSALKLALVPQVAAIRADAHQYWSMASKLCPGTYTGMKPATRLSKAVQLGKNIRGWFIPLVAPPSASAGLDARTPMVGCHVKIEGAGVQWTHHQSLRLEMVGGEYGLLRFGLSAAAPGRQSFFGGAAEGTPGNNAAYYITCYGRASQTQLILFAHATFHLSARLPSLSISEKQGYLFGAVPSTVQGLLLHSSEVAAFPPDDHGHVDCILHVHTHFGQVRVALQQQPSQQDANAPQSTMLSAEVGYQLQRSMLWAASCLTSSQAGVQAKGSEILDKIDLVERWCRLKIGNLDKAFARDAKKTDAQTDWHQTTIKDIVLSCCQAGQASGDRQNIFLQLDCVRNALTSNGQSIAAVLASPVLLEYQHVYHQSGLGISQWGSEAIRLVHLLGVSVASILVPVLLPAKLGTAVLRTLQALPDMLSHLQNAWAWFGVQEVYQKAYKQKLEQLLHVVAPCQPVQGNVSALENAVYTACQQAVLAESAFGEVIRGPNNHLGDIPAPLPTWTKSQLMQKDTAVSVLGSSVTIDCCLVLSAHMNRICAMADLRQSLQQCCLVGFVGDINAGKTSLVRSLLGIPLLADGHLSKNATQWVDAYPLPVPTAQGSRVVPESPLLVDTPGMFDQDSTLADYSVRYLGSMAMYVVVLSASKSARLDSAIQSQLVEIVSRGKPTLICLNQMSRFLDWWKSQEEADQACAAIRDGILSQAEVSHSLNASLVTVYLTELTQYDLHFHKLQQRNVKCLGEVRQWILEHAYISGL